MFSAGHPPKDGTITILRQMRLNDGLYATMCVLAGVGIILSVLLLGFNIKLRKRRQALILFIRI